jgi:Domain of unknown function (DUF6438)
VKLSWAFGAAVFVACTPRSPASNPSESPTVQADQAPVITLERTACFGSCPVYRLATSADGRVTYEGRAHVRQLGTASAQISPDQVQRLLSEFDRAGYFSFSSRYTPAEPVCGRYATDLPSAITSIRVDGRAKRIEHDYGCGAAPGALMVLERRIDEVLGSAQWTGR